VVFALANLSCIIYALMTMSMKKLQVHDGVSAAEIRFFGSAFMLLISSVYLWQSPHAFFASVSRD